MTNNWADQVEHARGQLQGKEKELDLNKANGGLQCKNREYNTAHR